MDRVIVGQATFACDGLDNRDAAFGGEGGDGFLSLRLAHASAGDDQRFLGGFQKPGSRSKRSPIGARARN